MMTTEIGKLVLRLGVAGLMMPHGYSKFNYFLEGGMDVSFGDPLGVGEIPTLIMAIIAELICPILIIVGFKTRLAAILPAITMFVAAFVVHIDDPWTKIEFPLLYLTGFLSIILIGPGKLSLDARTSRI